MSSSPRLLISVLTLGAGLALACSTETPVSEGEAPAPLSKEVLPAEKMAKLPVGPVAPSRGGFKQIPKNFGVTGTQYDEIKVTCCTNGRVNRVLDRVLDLHQAMVRKEGVSGAMDALAIAARDAEKEGALKPTSLAAVVSIAEAAESSKSEELSEQRQALLLIGRQVQVLIPAHAGGGRDLAKAMDPDTGDIWYQREGKAANPYGGSQARFTQ